MNEKKEPVLVEINKEQFDILRSALDFKNLKCDFCGIRIYRNNFGYIMKDVYSCKSPLCIVQALEKVERASGRNHEH